MSSRCAMGAVLLVLWAVAAPVFAQSWTDFCPDKGRYCVLFPGTPTESTHTDNNATTHMFTLHYQDVILISAYTDYPARLDVEGELLADRDNFLKAAGATLVASKRTQFERAAGNWLPALEFSAKKRNFAIRSFVTIDGQRGYMLATATPTDSNDFTTADRFLKSLRLKVRH